MTTWVGVLIGTIADAYRRVRSATPEVVSPGLDAAPGYDRRPSLGLLFSQADLTLICSLVRPVSCSLIRHSRWPVSLS
jgi:hypothetical protein